MKYYFLLPVLALSYTLSIAQNVAINESGSAPHESAILHVQSTTKGLLIPRMTTAQRNAIVSPATGLMVYDVQRESFWFRNSGGQWIEIRDMSDDHFIDGPVGIYTNESGIGVGGAPSAGYQKFFAVDSLNNTVHLALRNKHASGNTAIYLLDQGAAIGGRFEFDNADKQLYIQNSQQASGGDIIFRTNQFPENGNTNAEVLRIKRQGEIGIGTTTTDAKLHIVGTQERSAYLVTEYNSSASDSVFGINNLVMPSGLGVQYGIYSKVEMDSLNNNNAFGVRGQVEPNGGGIHWGVYGRANGDSNIGVEGISTLAGIGVKGTNTNSNGWAGYFDGNTYIEDRLEIRDKIFLRPSGNGSAGEIELYDNDGDETFILRAGQGTENGAEMLMYSDGNDLTIELDAEEAGNGGAIILADEEGDQTVFIRAAQGTSNGAEMLMHNDAGTLTIELDADFNAGKGRVITDELEITGGSDLAEHFDILQSDILIPGMLVSVDPSGSGKLIPTKSAYDRKVAGVISGANGVSPGMLMGQKASIADGDFPVALVGRVYVLADATRTPIIPGDLMTSSERPGYAMSVKQHKKAQGAVIGKAITGLKSGIGYVLILVNLQ